MRTTASLCTLVVAALVATGPAMAKKPNSSPAVVVIHVDDDGNCHVTPKSVTIVSPYAPPGTKGPKRVRFFYARGDADRGVVKMQPKSNQAHPDILDLPTIGAGADQGDSSEAKKKLAQNAPDYRFEYDVVIEIDGEETSCDPEIVIQKPGG
jgi:hypothetical protein